MNVNQEREANLFAMCLLMPENLVHAWMKKNGNVDLVDDSLLKAFSKEFCVPLTAAAVRLADLGYFKI